MDKTMVLVRTAVLYHLINIATQDWDTLWQLVIGQVMTLAYCTLFVWLLSRKEKRTKATNGVDCPRCGGSLVKYAFLPECEKCGYMSKEATNKGDEDGS